MVDNIFTCFKHDNIDNYIVDVKSTNTKVYPFLRWVGGKRQLLDSIKKLVPNTIDHFYDLFVGAGSVFMNMKFNSCTISDINQELIYTYIAIKDFPYDIINEISTYKIEYDFYYALRKKDYKEIKSKYDEKEALIKIASRMIFLNKTCYNGLYRVNSKGFFNAAFNKNCDKNSKILDTDNILNLSKFLKDKNINIRCNSFDTILEETTFNKNDFIYFDPPYAGNYTGYNSNKFDEDKQMVLFNYCCKLDNIGIKWMLSNSYNEIILKLYNKFNINTVYANRNINCNINKRNKVKEVIITNY
jgi:DNA adenine methylase